MPPGWQGLTETSSGRFLDTLRELLDLTGQAAGSSSAAAASSDDARTNFRTVRELGLRAASVYRRGMQSGELQSLSAKAERLLGRDLAREPEAISWALTEVLAWDSSRNAALRPGSAWRPSTKERRIMLALLVKRKVRKLRGALLAIARRPKDPLRSEALMSLSRWAVEFGPDEVVDVFLVKLLGRAAEFRSGPHPVNVVLERIESSEHPLSERAQEALRVRIAQLVIASDWRQCAMGIRLSRGMSLTSQVPILLDGLNVWNRRSQSDRDYQGMVRVRGDLTRELQRISGMKHGPEPGPWIAWWVEVRQGQRPMPGTPEFAAAAAKAAKEPVSTAGFFGLKPMTDRVTFIIDHSGSMDNNWGTTKRSRYEEAIDQMMRFLQGADSDTKFNVILFDDVPVRSSLELVEAAPKNLERARKSLLFRQPGGSTCLRPAVELAMGIGADGLPAFGAKESEVVDTIVVLCDGATEEGMSWVAPFLKRTLPLYPVVFHTVHLGPKDDGALNELARLSGGDFLRVGN